MPKKIALPAVGRNLLGRGLATEIPVGVAVRPERPLLNAVNVNFDRGEIGFRRRGERAQTPPALVGFAADGDAVVQKGRVDRGEILASDIGQYRNTFFVPNDRALVMVVVHRGLACFKKQITGFGTHTSAELRVMSAFGKFIGGSGQAAVDQSNCFEGGIEFPSCVDDRLTGAVPGAHHTGRKFGIIAGKIRRPREDVLKTLRPIVRRGVADSGQQMNAAADIGRGLNRGKKVHSREKARVGGKITVTAVFERSEKEDQIIHRIGLIIRGLNPGAVGIDRVIELFIELGFDIRSPCFSVRMAF